LAIEWDSLIVEMIILAGIIWFTVYIENWAYKRLEIQKDKKTKYNVISFLKNDLEQRQRFIDESLHTKDYKPFFTDMWDSIIISGKHTLISFELFQSVQRTYSWLKYYNTELESNSKDNEIKEKTIRELLEEIRKSIRNSLTQLENERIR
jgi:hypothetical protein